MAIPNFIYFPSCQLIHIDYFCSKLWLARDSEKDQQTTEEEKGITYAPRKRAKPNEGQEADLQFISEPTF